MRTFRAYLLDPAGKIVWAEWIEAADLTAAEVRAHKLCEHGIPMVEVWDGPRHLSDVPCDSAKAPERTLAGQMD